MTAPRFIAILCFFISFCHLTEAHAEVIVVDNVTNSDPGSLRDAVAAASDNDTILINIKGTIYLDSPIDFIGFSNLTVIGPYPKHNTISPTASCSGSLFNIDDCEDLRFQGLGFVGENGITRHVVINNSVGIIIFEKCLFKDNIVTGLIGSIKVNNSFADFYSCSFINNIAETGGAILFRSGARSTITNCTFARNAAINRAGAIQVISGSIVNLYYNTFVNNTATNLPQAIRVGGPSVINMENNAIGDNGTAQQIQKANVTSEISSSGGNRIKLNYIGEPTDMPAPFTGDYSADDLTFVMGLRSAIKTDGFGLMYYPIVDPLSTLINPAVPTAQTPGLDCRSAPRSLKGPDATAYPDAGASEYTHLRVTNDSGDKTDANSFLWTLEAVRRKDVVSYIEFDIVSPGDIIFEDEGDVLSDAYIIDGFSQHGSAIPGPHEISTPGLTRAILTIDFVNGGSHDHGIRFQSGTENSILQGVSVQDFHNHGVETNAENISIYGCEIGINNAGDENGTRNSGVWINAGNTTVGGWEHWMRNVVSGNGLIASERANINIDAGTDNRIVGNIIGGTADGLGSIGGGQTRYGIRNNTAHNTIGGILINTGNIIIDNENGIYHTRWADFVSTKRNKIGVGWDGLTPVGNSVAGISLNGCDNNLIGGYNEEEGNIIAHNQAGITLATSSTIAEGNRILANLIYANEDQGIDIGADATILPNDGDTSDTQQNKGLDFPVLISSENCEGIETRTTFELSVPTGEDYHVEFFSNTSPDSPNGEGEIFRGVTNVTVTTNPETFTFGHGVLIPSGQTLSATVTQIRTGNTSEFGQNVLVAAAASDPAFEYDDICVGDTAKVTPLGDPGGAFRFTLPAPVGVTLDPVTGDMVGGLEGVTYEIVYGFGGTCEVEDTTTFEVITVEEVFTFADFCIDGDSSSTAPVIDIGADPDSVFFKLVGAMDGETINFNTGVIYNPVEGITYTVVDSARNEGCWQSHSVTVVPLNVDESFTMDNFCAGIVSSPGDPETLLGTFSFASLPGDGASIDGGTGAISGGVEGNSYMVKYEVGTCGEESILEVFTHVADEHFTYPDFCPGDNGEVGTFVIDGGYSFLPPGPGDGAIINAGTGVITMAEEGATYMILHTVGVCLDKDTVETHVIEVHESFTFADFCIDGDSSSTAPVIDIGADPDSAFFKLLGALDPTNINLNSGIIYSPVEGDAYTVVDSVRNNGCWQSDTTIVTALNVNEAFTMADICYGDTGIAVVELELLDTFYFDPDPLDGAYIDPYTGKLTFGDGGATYHVWRIVFDGACKDTADQMVSVVNPNATFTINDFCPDGAGSMPEPVSTDDDSWYFDTPPLYGETMSDEGIIYGGLEDSTYTITHEVGSGLLGCRDTFTLSVHVFQVNQEFFHLDFCWYSGSGDAAPVEGIGESVFAFGSPPPGDGAAINMFTGAISSAVEGNDYEVVHTYTSLEECTQADSITISAIGVDESFTFSDFCPQGPSDPPIPATLGGVFTFSPEPGDGAYLDDDGIIYSAVEGSSYTLKYTVDALIADCPDSSEITVMVTETDESFVFNDFCAETNGFPESTAEPSGNFFFAPDLLDDAEIELATGEISFAVPGTTYPVIYIVGTCMERDTHYVRALESDIAEFILDDHCANIELEATITGTTGGSFFFDPSPGDGAEINGDNGIITSPNGGEYIIKYLTTGSDASCADTITKTVTIHVVPVITDLNAAMDIYCPYDELTTITSVSTDASKIYWYAQSPDGTLLDSTFDYLPESLNLGDNLFYAQPISEEGCLGNFESYTFFLSDTSGMGAIPDFEICLGSPAQLEAFGGTSYEWTTTVPMADNTISNPVVFSLTEEIYVVSILNNDGCEVIDSIRVSFLSRDECNIEIYNAFSPNDDGRNDFWYIDNLINYMPNTVYIYNRWGDEIREIKDYDNLNAYWDGTDKSGNNLAPNTYFYVVITDDPGQNQAGWVQLVR